MRLAILLVFTLLTCIGCKHKTKPMFDADLFLEMAAQNKMLSQDEVNRMRIQMQGVPEKDIHVTAYLAKKESYETTAQAMGFPPVNPDSIKSFRKLFYEQHEQIRAQGGSKTQIKDAESMLSHSTNFLRALHEEDYLTATQYAKALEKIKAEPMPFPFLTFELIETMQ